MATWQIILLVALAAVLLVVTIVTWGSLGSIMTGFSLLLIGLALLYRHFLIDRDGDDYQMDP